MYEGDNLSSAAKASPDRVNVSQRGPVTLVQLSRPSKRNAIDAAMVASLDAIFSAPPEGTRAIVLHGDGSHFCAGADLSVFTEVDAAAGVRLLRSVHQAFDRIENGIAPVIAVLHGGVIGGGLEVAASAHIRIAERSTFYALPEATRGIFVGGGGCVRVPRLVGAARMIDMMLTGRTYSADEGQALGFSQYVVEDGVGLDTAIRLAERIAANATLTNFAVVQALPRIARADPDIGLLMESLMATLVIGDSAAQKRIADFLQKRAAKVAHPAVTRE